MWKRKGLERIDERKETRSIGAKGIKQRKKEDEE
jgi:hypothetical protein